MPVTIAPITEPIISICDVEAVGGLWSPGFLGDEDITMVFSSSYLDNDGYTVSHYDIKINIGEKTLRTWILTLDLSIVFNDVEVLG